MLGAQARDRQVLGGHQRHRGCFGAARSGSRGLRGGGKVHGSLARAGKVKGQTPKVEKSEESKKNPRGRAMKRMQYNRRFVNVVATAGGKRFGPNSNAAKAGV